VHRNIGVSFHETVPLNKDLCSEYESGKFFVKKKTFFSFLVYFVKNCSIFGSFIRLYILGELCPNFWQILQFQIKMETLCSSIISLISTQAQADHRAGTGLHLQYIYTGRPPCRDWTPVTVYIHRQTAVPGLDSSYSIYTQADRRAGTGL